MFTIGLLHFFSSYRLVHNRFVTFTDFCTIGLLHFKSMLSARKVFKFLQQTRHTLRQPSKQKKPRKSNAAWRLIWTKERTARFDACKMRILSAEQCLDKPRRPCANITRKIFKAQLFHWLILQRPFKGVANRLHNVPLRTYQKGNRRGIGYRFPFLSAKSRSFCT